MLFVLGSVILLCALASIVVAWRAFLTHTAPVFKTTWKKEVYICGSLGSSLAVFGGSLLFSLGDWIETLKLVAMILFAGAIIVTLFMIIIVRFLGDGNGQNQK